MITVTAPDFGRRSESLVACDSVLRRFRGSSLALLNHRSAGAPRTSQQVKPSEHNLLVVPIVENLLRAEGRWQQNRVIFSWPDRSIDR
jgi:hypothetical protein